MNVRMTQSYSVLIHKEGELENDGAIRHFKWEHRGKLQSVLSLRPSPWVSSLRAGVTSTIFREMNGYFWLYCLHQQDTDSMSLGWADHLHSIRQHQQLQWDASRHIY